MHSTQTYRLRAAAALFKMKPMFLGVNNRATHGDDVRMMANLRADFVSTQTLPDSREIARVFPVSAAVAGA